jgi:cellulose synthase/poly-beta-1,6-N-acetylglucosamine synthase-like glycosyltransferase
MESLFWWVVALVLLQGLLGAAEGMKYLTYIWRYLGIQQPSWTPGASVFLPCKGAEEGLSLNVEALLDQDYPDYEVIFVTADSNDSALLFLREQATRHPQRTVKFAAAGTTDDRGEKVNNLIEAVSHASPKSEVFVFTDSDCRPHQLWLRQLIAPLTEPSVGVSTGYRWCFPEKDNFAGALRSTWNASIATLLGDHDRNFCWGGSMAIRRETFERARVLDCWRHSVSDDYSMSIAVRAAGLTIHYEPRCLTGSHGRTRLREFLQWATRQLLLTRVYSPRLWSLAFIFQIPFVAGWWWLVGNCAVDITRLLQGAPNLYPHSLWPRILSIFMIYCLSMVRGIYRLKAITLIRADSRSEILRYAWAHVLMAPLVSTVTAYALLASLLTRRLEWRGVEYELISPREVRVIRNV